MRITIIIASLDKGGAQRVISILAREWAQMGHCVTLMTLDDGPSAYLFPSSVCRICLHLNHNSPNWLMALRNNLHCLLKLRRALQSTQPSVVISFIDTTNVLVLLALCGAAIPAIVSERVHPKYSEIAWPWKLLRRAVYGWASCLVTQSQAAMDFFTPRIRKHACIIPNPVPAFTEKRHHWEQTCRLVSVGRLVPVKQFDLLLSGFALALRDNPGWHLRIVGEGPLLNSLLRLRDHLQLQDHVEFLSNKDNICDVFRDADFFVSTSAYEGFPNALCEAMAYGLPVIAMDCPGGTSNIVRAGVDGLLVPLQDVHALATAISQLMRDPQLRFNFSIAAREIVERFSLTSVMEKWNQLILNVTGDAGAYNI